MPACQLPLLSRLNPWLNRHPSREGESSVLNQKLVQRRRRFRPRTGIGSSSSSCILSLKVAVTVVQVVQAAGTNTLQWWGDSAVQPWVLSSVTAPVAPTRLPLRHHLSLVLGCPSPARFLGSQRYRDLPDTHGSLNGPVSFAVPCTRKPNQCGDFL